MGRHPNGVFPGRERVLVCESELPRALVVLRGERMPEAEARGRARDRRVEASALRGRDLLIRHVAQDRVTEAELLVGLGNHDVQVGCGAECVRDRLRRSGGDLLEQPHIERATDHRGRRDDLSLGGIEQAEPRHHGVADGLEHGGLGVCGDEFLEVQRDAVAAALQRVDHRGGRSLRW